MTSANPSRPFATVGKRLIFVLATVLLACALVSVGLQPASTSAQETEVTPSVTTTSSAGNDLVVGKEISPTTTPVAAEAGPALYTDKGPQPTVTPQGTQRSAVTLAIRSAADGSASAGVPVTYTRGYSGLVASYYNTIDLSGPVVFTESWRKPINFEQWCTGQISSYYAGCKLASQVTRGDWYSVRWQGKLIVPADGNYTFTFLQVDDKVRFYVDGALIIDYWSSSQLSASRVLTAGLHDIRIDYAQTLYNAVSLVLQWSGPDFANEIIPVAAVPPDCGCPIRPNCCQGKKGGPINTYTGDYDYEVQDISLPALGQALQFKRVYNSSRTGITSSLSYGWTSNYNMRLAISDTQSGGESGAVVLYGCGGERFPFLRSPGGDTQGIYEAMPGIWASLTRTLASPIEYHLVTGDQAHYIFDATGLLIAIYDSSGNVTNLTYSGTQLMRVADATGLRYLNFAYNSQGRLTQISDPLSRTVDYGYNAGGDLAVVTDTSGGAWTYSYTGTHLLQEMRNPLGELIERTEFDSLNRAIRQWRGTNPPLQIQYTTALGAQGIPEATSIITDPLGHVTIDRYNGRGTLIERIEADASAGSTFDSRYNPAGNTDPNGNNTRYIYNSLGRPLVITDAQGNSTLMQYDAQNHLTQMTDARGNSTYYTYTGNLLTAQSDALGHTQIYTYGPGNLLVAQQDAQRRVTEYAYDPWGQRTAVTTTEGVMHYEYDPVGRLITTTDTFNRVTVNAYDNADRLLVVTRNYLAGQLQNYQHAYNLITRYEYDRAGRQTAITDTLGHVTRNVYDADGQLIRTIVNYDPARAQNELNQYNITTEYGYDAAGHQTLVTDTLGHASRTEYDTQSRPVTVTTNYKDGVYDPAHPDEDIIRVTQYDPAGNAIAQIDPLGRVTRTWYDEVNRVISTTSNYRADLPRNAGGEYNLVTAYGYDETGNRILITDTLGHATRNYYDATGRLISTTANYLPGFAQNYLNQYNLITF